MVSVKILALAGATAPLSTATNAADMSYPPLLPPIHAPQYEDFSGWYLRGDIGMTNQSVGSITNVLDATDTSVTTVQKGFDSSMLFGLGVGYQFNNWMRFDATGEYRSKANFHGLQVVQTGGATQTDEYRASKSEWLFLANAYVDLGTWWCLTPFVGAGIGGSYNKISDFLDVNTPVAGVAFAPDAGKWNFAWALHAGVAYKATPQMTIEFAYRYVNLGSAMSGDLGTYLGGNTVVNPENFNNITSHDFKLGIRWLLDPPPPPRSMDLPPLMRRG